jgi:hypothetical protein
MDDTELLDLMEENGWTAQCYTRKRPVKSRTRYWVIRKGEWGIAPGSTIREAIAEAKETVDRLKASAASNDESEAR